jgi:hypothetical protein
MRSFLLLGESLQPAVFIFFDFERIFFSFFRFYGIFGGGGEGHDRCFLKFFFSLDDDDLKVTLNLKN